LKPEELAAVDGVDLVLGATEKFKITDYINDLSKNDFGEVHSCEIADADFYVEVTR
jgi:threonylcarbamoyladenosine tRNA methylthiotransferase MtaB